MKNKQKVRRKINLFLEKIKKGRYMKFSKEVSKLDVIIALKDCKDYIKKRGGKIIGHQFGIEGDDFAKNTFSCVVWFYHRKQDKRL